MIKSNEYFRAWGSMYTEMQCRDSSTQWNGIMAPSSVLIVRKDSSVLGGCLPGIKEVWLSNRDHLLRVLLTHSQHRRPGPCVTDESIKSRESIVIGGIKSKYEAKELSGIPLLNLPPLRPSGISVCPIDSQSSNPKQTLLSATVTNGFFQVPWSCSTDDSLQGLGTCRCYCD